MRNMFTIVLGALFLTGCAGTGSIPDTIREAPPQEVTFEDVRDDADRARGEKARWGGQIAGIEHGPTYTRVEIVTRPLERRGRPETDGDETFGRFIARVDSFLEPDIYTRGRPITVTGTVEGVESGLIGDFEYPFPVIRAFDHHLWETARQSRQRERANRSTHLRHRHGFHSGRHLRGHRAGFHGHGRFGRRW
ncbi:Slp family lipoprotein [Aquisalimonas sp.]|uniref:Slp family lipoprotein n=1 Tax=Aquisalimonas sp. TaxID=1872621 RepID=UPI0025BDE7A2|nr:Slp family lipoprotein [Aquisalimonas sp.]